MMKSYFRTPSSVIQLSSDGDTHFVFRLRSALNITSHMRAWDFVDRFFNKEDAMKMIMKLSGCANEESLKSKIMDEERVEKLIDSYIANNS